MYLAFKNLKTRGKKVHRGQEAKSKKATADVFSC